MTFKPDDDTAHSTIVGGSTAARRIGCPGSYGLEQKLPKSLLNQSSSYADEGTAMHAAIEYILTNQTDVDEVRGMEFEGLVITSTMIDDGIGPAIDYFEALQDELTESDGDFEFAVEQRCEIPGIPGAFGTSDIIFKTPKRSGIVDWKFGVGKAVYASDKDGVPNPQLAFYARAAMHTRPDMFVDKPTWPVDLHIVQPRLRDGPNFSVKPTDTKYLRAFRDLLVRAVAEAKSERAKVAKGDWCTFCKAKTICPEWTGPALDLSKMRKLAPSEFDAELVGLILDLAYGAEEWAREALALGHRYMEEGNAVSGYKLVAKRATEKYIDPVGAQRMAVEKHGVPHQHTLTEPEVKSPAQLRAVLAEKMEGSTKKAREAAAKEAVSAFTSNVSSGTTVAFEDDKREAVMPAPAALAKLSTRLAELAGR